MIKPCKHCGGQVATTAKACPHCGAPQGLGFSITRVIVLFIIIVVGIFVLASL